jgi:hypothetical protein
MLGCIPYLGDFAKLGKYGKKAGCAAAEAIDDIPIPHTPDVPTPSTPDVPTPKPPDDPPTSKPDPEPKPDPKKRPPCTFEGGGKRAGTKCMYCCYLCPGTIPKQQICRYMPVKVCPLAVPNGIVPGTLDKNLCNQWLERGCEGWDKYDEGFYNHPDFL